jgi:peptidoglycan hydrolase-like protein with peptidoglycan-binding domain
MALRSRPGVALLGLALGTALAGTACTIEVAREAVPAPSPITSASSTPPAPQTATPSPRTSAPSAGPSKTRTRSPERSAPTAPPRAAEPSREAPPALMSSGDRGERVRELQHRLRQLEWFEGSISGTYGRDTSEGVTGFQGKRGLKQSGAVDQRTWKRLTAMTREPTNDELHNRLVPGRAILKTGSDGDQVRELQARLKQIGWFASDVSGVYGKATTGSVRGFQAKRAIPETGEVDQRTWNRLTAMTSEPTDDAKHNREPKRSSGASTRGLDSRCLNGRVICISKRSNSLTWVVDGNAKLRMDVRFGADETPTRNGSFRVFRKTRNGVSTLYHTPMPWAMTFSGGQAVHYSPDFAARGYNGASHGCVNVRNRSGIRWLWNEVQIGDRVVVYA